MPATAPFHSSKRDVYHNNSACIAGQNVRQQDRVQGAGGLPLCQDCAKLNKDGK